MYNNDELQMCTIKRVEDTFSFGPIIYHEGQLNSSEDMAVLDECTTDLLCNIADQIHLKSLKDAKT
jgi:hypothetical protein